MAEKKSIILVTGANVGIGFELVSQLLSDSTKHVLLGSRSSEKGEAAVKELQSRQLPGVVEFLQIDVSSKESIEAAAKKVESDHGRLDAVVNNAGVGGPEGPIEQKMLECFRVNAVGPQLVVDAFTPLLKKSSGTPRIINVSSGLGSITKRPEVAPHDGSDIKVVHYRASKSALNMVTACQAVDLSEFGFKVFAFCPGFTVSHLSPTNKAEFGARPTSEGAAPIVDILNGARDAEHGKFLHGEGQYPW